MIPDARVPFERKAPVELPASLQAELRRINRREELYRWAEFCVLATQADISKTHANFQRWRDVQYRLTYKTPSDVLFEEAEAVRRSLLDAMQRHWDRAFTRGRPGA